MRVHVPRGDRAQHRGLTCRWQGRQPTSLCPGGSQVHDAEVTPLALSEGLSRKAVEPSAGAVASPLAAWAQG